MIFVQIHISFLLTTANTSSRPTFSLSALCLDVEAAQTGNGRNQHVCHRSTKSAFSTCWIQCWHTVSQSFVIRPLEHNVNSAPDSNSTLSDFGSSTLLELASPAAYQMRVALGRDLLASCLFCQSTGTTQALVSLPQLSPPLSPAPLVKHILLFGLSLLYSLFGQYTMQTPKCLHRLQ